MMQVFISANAIVATHASPVAAALYPGARALFVPDGALATADDGRAHLPSDAESLRAIGRATLDAQANATRAAIVGTDPAKLVTYELKRQLAIAGLPASGPVRDAVAIEAEALGTDADTLAAMWRSRGAAWVLAALRIDALTAASRVRVGDVADLGGMLAVLDAHALAMAEAVGAL